MTGDREVILVLVEGKAAIQAAGQDWGVLGDRMDVFDTHAAALPVCAERQPTGRRRATTACTLAVCSAPGKGGHKAARLGPDGITLTQRGTGANTRFINNIAMEGLDVADSLLVTEVFTPAGQLVVLSQPPP